tara:strand:- start:441 stop:761 length:321 start_codon:yes stop_codon:yes gene_type:complete
MYKDFCSKLEELGFKIRYSSGIVPIYDFEFENKCKLIEVIGFQKTQGYDDERDPYTDYPNLRWRYSSRRSEHTSYLIMSRYSSYENVVDNIPKEIQEEMIYFFNIL